MGRGRGFEFWCCAIPLINVGSYVTVIEIALVAFITAILAIAGSPFVAGLDVIPSFAKAIVAALGFVTCAWQIIGLISIKRESPKLYHIYVRVTTLLTLAILGVTIAFFAVAASQHSKAQSACNTQYGALPSTTSTGYTNDDITQNFGDQICNYFIWAQVGTMGGLIVLVGLVQLYMCFALRAYGVAQRAAYRDYKTSGGGGGVGGFGNNATKDDEIPLSSRNVGAGNSEIWEPSRDSEYAYAGNGAAARQGIPPQGSYDDPRATRRYSAAPSPTSPTGYGYQDAPHNSHDAGYYNAHSYDTDPGYAAPYGNTTGYPAYAGGAAQGGRHGAAAGGGSAYPAYPAY